MSLIPARAFAPLERSFESVGLLPEWPGNARDALGAIDYARHVAAARRLRNDAIAGTFGGLARRVAGWVRARIVAPLRAAAQRDRAIAELSRLDDVSLHDLGISRSTIWHAVHAGRETPPAAANQNGFPARPVAA